MKPFEVLMWMLLVVAIAALVGTVYIGNQYPTEFVRIETK